jgi:bifunctional non-homologous end joining protein LigD
MANVGQGHALDEYRAKRDFALTPEPAGELADPASSRPIFCVQKHAASSLHYDLRLEVGGVLKSWAVPKGPSLDPANKHLAVHVEDHPLDYATFEGVIPEGEYGAGTVMLWDYGWWEPDARWSKEFAAQVERGENPDVAGKLAAGELKFILHGQKLTGSFVLVQMKGRGAKNWLLLKHKDHAARPGYSVTEEQALSVATGRSLEEIALGEPPPAPAAGPADASAAAGG